MTVIFVAYHDFHSNSSIQVFSLANCLVDLGHRVHVCVPSGKESAKLPGIARFSCCTYKEALDNPLQFGLDPNGQVIHAWTPREGVRKFAEKLRDLLGCPVITHLEDNEEVVAASLLGLDRGRLMAMPDEVLDTIIPDSLSHPNRFREFLKCSSGITMLIDRLEEFVPAGVPSLTFWPAHNHEIFRESPPLLEERRRLGLADHEKVLAYTGNVTSANRQEVASLYLAVIILRRLGYAVRLIRTGTDWVPLFDVCSEEISSAIISLGSVEHHTEIPRLIGMADFLVQPGKASPYNDYRFPSKLPEFFSVGRPVLLPETNLGRFVRDGVDAVILREGHSMEIADQLLALIHDPEKCDRLSKGALAFCREHFNWANVAAKLAEFYKTCCDAQLVKIQPCSGHITKVSLESASLLIEGWVTAQDPGPIRNFRVLLKQLSSPTAQHLSGNENRQTTHYIPSTSPAQSGRQAFTLGVPRPSWLSASPQDLLVIVQPIFDAGRGAEIWLMLDPSLAMPPEELATAVGGYYLSVAFTFLQYFVNQAGLRPHERVLDVGCGSGRMAYSLSYYLSPQGSYLGFDIVPELVNWAQQEIGGRFPNFQFQHVPVHNSHYNPKGTVPPAEFRFPCSDGEFDFVFLTSVFTHMQPVEVRHYLGEIARVLKRGGRCLLTCFLLTAESTTLMAEGQGSRKLIHPRGEAYVEKPDDPDYAVGFPEDLFLSWCKYVGLSVHAVCYGDWCGRSHPVSYQDFLVLRKT